MIANVPKIGVFALNISPKSGGVYNLIDGLMAHAQYSKYNYLYLSQTRPMDIPLPSNVETITRHPMIRMANQVVLRTSKLNTLFRHRNAAIAALAACSGISPGVIATPRAWLWPHCFGLIPNLAGMVPICHDMIHYKYPENFDRSAHMRRATAESSLMSCPSILCPSNSTANDLLSVYPVLKSQVYVATESPCEIMEEDSHTVESQYLNDTYGKTPIFLYVGVDWPHKNHKLLIQAAVMLRAMTSKPFKVLLVGHRRSTNITKEISCNPACAGLVTDIGSVSRAMLAALYRHSTALVFPSLYEGFGIPLVEAMQYGLPIIASDQSCVPEICGNSAILLNPTLPSLWAHEMLHLMTNKDHQMKQAVAAKAMSYNYSWQHTWQQIDEVFTTVLERGI